eukprot:c8726_g1_i1.p1 GENE.c8726_g1_i1~~c8726_g1_i1.p1  ORF type:complete len:319 (-),score=88.61 c8726_g1_i1:18-974(-)
MADKARTKITVVGAGQVGMACAISILTQKLCDELAIVDVMVDKLRGEVLDLQHGTVWLHNAKVIGSDDYAVSADSKVVIITAGARQRVGESRLELCQRNVEIFKSVVPNVVKYSPNCVIVVISNPADVMTYVTWKLSGLPVSRVFGTGTSLDTSRFRHMLGERLGVGPSSIGAFVIGEHGDSSVPVWSSANIGGVPIDVYAHSIGIENFQEEYKNIHTQVVESAMEIIKLKGYTNWGIGLTCAGIVGAIVRNSRSVHAVSTLVQGSYGIEDEVFVSVPCSVGAAGVKQIVGLQLSDSERSAFLASVNAVWGVSQGLKL